MLYVMLPDGKYTVRAQFDGRTESMQVRLDDRRGKDLYFHWQGKPKA